MIHGYGNKHVCSLEGIIEKILIQILNCYLITDIEIRYAGTSGSIFRRQKIKVEWMDTRVMVLSA